MPKPTLPVNKWRKVAVGTCRYVHWEQIVRCQVNIEMVISTYCVRVAHSPILVSATLVHIPNHGYILLDAGEGTWGQLARKFGDDSVSTSGVWQVLRQLKCIFISHMHGDHHIGLAKILAMRQRVSIRTRNMESDN